MTKVITQDAPIVDNGEQLKPIEFIYMDAGMKTGCRQISNRQPKDWQNIELICRKADEVFFDIMLAYDDNERDFGFIYFGYFNAGIV